MRFLNSFQLLGTLKVQVVVFFFFKDSESNEEWKANH